ncbi:WD40-repeat-containing domain protein, partial [Dimargaris cristalligena]
MRRGRIELQHQPLTLEFHPEEPILATGLVTGEIYAHRVHNGSGEKILRRGIASDLAFTTRPHTKPCRSLGFHPSGQYLYTASRDKSWASLDTHQAGKVVFRKTDAHEEPLSHIRVMDEHNLMTGDDAGGIKLWDTRSPRVVREFGDIHSDLITDSCYSAARRTLLVAGADGLLTVLDLRKDKPLAVSENQDDDLLSVMAVKDNSRAVVGMQSGVLGIFKWGDWGDIVDRFPGHPESVDTLAKIDEDTLCTGSSDGIIRVVSIQPNKLIGVVGVHGRFPVEKLDFSTTGHYLASMSHDTTVKL